MAGYAQQAVDAAGLNGSVGTTAAMNVVPANSARGRSLVIVQNTHASQNLGVTFDGATPVIGGNAITLVPNGSILLDSAVPQGGISVIGSGSGTTYMIYTG